ncbi:hypothetical protein TSOC_005694 [Tetrabaena socialis]|uniref:Uncharacterized protein n=1 Tax=Tetrabaena socialis TaxID=47790 RepID=A0A2J8A5M0_9CHLO|nr:hypothetical protein TSOC_005694 [Tetrabaena socialis]|eukprot:PNH07800.1 hypothetical protein TSOC_005694 [Tetrabaena socialis]
MSALEGDVYPDASVEGIFGVQKDPGGGGDLSAWPIGNLTYGAWITVRNHTLNAKLEAIADDDDDDDGGLGYNEAALQAAEQEFKGEIVAAILQGRLPAWYEARLRQLRDASYYVQEVVARRSFADIVWDTQVLDRLAGLA